MSAYDILTARGVTRLCHFTKFQSLTHIMASEVGVLASSSIRSDIKNVTDKERYDGELNYVCCSVEYPNSWFLHKAMTQNSDNVFKDWLTVYIDLDILNLNDAKFCPCNAGTDWGRYITDDVTTLFANPVRCKRVFYRESQMLDCCTTDGQAEIMIKDGIPRSYINGFAVGDEDMAKRVYAMLATCGIKQVSIYIAPTIMTPAWSDMIKRGQRPSEELFVCSEGE